MKTIEANFLFFVNAYDVELQRYRQFAHQSLRQFFFVEIWSTLGGKMHERQNI